MRRSVTFAYPGDLALNTGGYGYDRRLIAGLAAKNWTVTPLALGDGFPAPTAIAKQQAEQRLSALPDKSIVLVDGLAFGVLDDWAAREANRLIIVALVHHPLALETGIDDDESKRLHESERRALSFARHVIATSAMTAHGLESTFGVAADSLTVAAPGTDPGPAAAGRGDPPHILSIGTLTPRKGHDILIAALKQVEHLTWRATIVGSATLNPATADALRRQVEALGLNDRVVLAGERDNARECLADADIFALASRYEGYGMVFAEALSQGLPIVACRAGAIPDVVGEEAGILVPVDDVDAFAQALHDLLTDEPLRQAKADASRRVGAQLPSWDDTAEIVSSALERVS